MTMNDTQINTLIAQKVMGWDYADKWGNWYSGGKPVPQIGWNPRESVADALESLGVWLKQNNHWLDLWSDGLNHEVDIMENVKLEWSCGCYAEDQSISHARSTNLAHAICDALIQATGE